MEHCEFKHKIEGNIPNKHFNQEDELKLDQGYSDESNDDDDIVFSDVRKYKTVNQIDLEGCTKNNNRNGVFNSQVQSGILISQYVQQTDRSITIEQYKDINAVSLLKSINSDDHQTMKQHKPYLKKYRSQQESTFNNRMSKQIIKLLKRIRNDNLDSDQSRILEQELNYRPLNLQVTKEHSKLVYNFEQDDILRIIDIEQTLKMLNNQEYSMDYQSHQQLDDVQEGQEKQMANKILQLYNSQNGNHILNLDVQREMKQEQTVIRQQATKISTINDEVIKYIRFFNDGNKIAYLGRKSKIRVYEVNSLYQYPKPWLIQFKQYQVDWFDITQDGNYLAISVQKSRVIIFKLELDIKTKQIDELEQIYSYSHANQIEEIKFTYDQKYLVSSSFNSMDTQIILYKMYEQKTIVIEEQNNQVYDFDLSSNSQVMATVGSDHTVRLYDLLDIDIVDEDGQVVCYKEQKFDMKSQICCLSLSSDGLSVAIGNDDHQIIIINSLCQSDDYQLFYVKSKRIQRLFFIMDNQYLTYVSKENSIYFLNVGYFNKQWTEICEKKIRQLVISNDLKYLAALCDNNIIKIIDYNKNQQKQKTENYIQYDDLGDILYDTISDYADYDYKVIKALDFTPDGRYLVFVGKNTLEHYEVHSKQMITMKNTQYEKYLDDYFYEVKFSWSKYMLVYGEKQKVYFFRMDQLTGLYIKYERSIEVHYKINDIAISYDENILGIVGDFKHVKLFDLSQDQLKIENLCIQDMLDIESFTKIAFSENNVSHIGLVGNDKKIYVYNRHYLTWHNFDEQSKYVNQILFHNLEKNLMSVGNDGTVKLYNIQNQETSVLDYRVDMKIKDVIRLNDDQKIIYSGNSKCIYTMNNIFDNQQKFLKILTYFQNNIDADIQDLNIDQFRTIFNIQVIWNVNFIYFLFLYFVNNHLFTSKDNRQQDLSRVITKIFEALIHHKIQIHFSQEFYTEEFDQVSFLNIYELQDLQVKMIFIKYIISIPKYQCRECRQNIYDILMISLKNRINIPSGFLDYFLIDLDFQINLQSDEHKYYFRSTKKQLIEKFFRKVHKRVINQRENQKNLTFQMYDVEMKNQLDYKDINDYIQNDIIQVINRNYQSQDDVYQSELLQYLVKYQWKRYGKMQFTKEGIKQAVFLMSYMWHVAKYSIIQIKKESIQGIEKTGDLFLIVCYIFNIYFNVSKLYDELKELYMLRKFQEYNQIQNEKYTKSQEQIKRLSNTMRSIQKKRVGQKRSMAKQSFAKKMLNNILHKYSIASIGGMLVKELNYKSYNIYFKSYWNNFEIICFSLICTLNILELSSSYIFDGRMSLVFIEVYSWLLLVTVFLANINMLKYFRVSEKFSGLFRLIGNVINDMKYFLAIFGLFVVNFIWFFYIYQVRGFKEQHTSNSHTYISYSWFSIIRYVVLLSLGDFGDFIKADSHGSLDADKNSLPDTMSENTKSYFLFIFFFFAAILLQVVMLNLLISIIGESYSQFKANEAQSILYERVTILSEINRGSFDSQQKKIRKSELDDQEQEDLLEYQDQLSTKPFCRSIILQKYSLNQKIKSKIIIIHKKNTLDRGRNNDSVNQQLSNHQKHILDLNSQIQKLQQQQQQQIDNFQQVVRHRNQQITRQTQRI